jgi:hypothetical protein
MMNKLLLRLVATAGVLTISGATWAASCQDQATEKKLAGAAATSFIKKCEADAGGATTASSAAAKCDAQAAEKKLAGAAKTSFVKKCVTDAGG